MRKLFAATCMLAIPGLALAIPLGANVPEPESLALIGIGAVALMIARWGKRK